MTKKAKPIRTVSETIAWLQQFPSDANVYAFEGNIITSPWWSGIVVTKGRKELGTLETVNVS